MPALALALAFFVYFLYIFVYLLYIYIYFIYIFLYIFLYIFIFIYNNIYIYIYIFCIFLGPTTNRNQLTIQTFSTDFGDTLGASGDHYWTIFEDFRKSLFLIGFLHHHAENPIKNKVFWYIHIYIYIINIIINLMFFYMI